MIAASSRSVNSPQLMLCTGGSNIQNRKTYVAPTRAIAPGTRQARQSARVRRDSATGEDRSTSPARPALLVIRFIAIRPPRPSAKAGSTGQSRLVSGPSAVVW